MEENDTTGLFSIKVRVGNAAIEVFAPEKDFVLNESNRLIEQFILIPTVLNSTDQTTSFNNESSFSIAPEAKPAKAQNLVEFLKRFNSLPTNLEKILVLGYWCEVKLGQPHFTAEDIQAKYKEIRDTPPTNPYRDLEKVRTKGFLMPPEKSENGLLTYTLSSSGIKEVEAKMSQA